MVMKRAGFARLWAVKKSDAPPRGASDGQTERSSKLPLLEERDYYLEGGLMVFTAHYLMQRGYCCENGCRHCPYDKEVEKR
jgi:hypothetical protein